MPYVSPRPVSQVEADVVWAALASERASMPWTRDDVARLVVHSECGCGCATVGFVPKSERLDGEVLAVASAVGHTPDDRTVQLLVYGTETRLVELEVFWSEGDGAPLPTPRSIRPG